MTIRIVSPRSVGIETMRFYLINHVDVEKFSRLSQTKISTKECEASRSTSLYQDLLNRSRVSESAKNVSHIILYNE